MGYFVLIFTTLVVLIAIAIILLIITLPPKELNDALSLQLWEKKPINLIGEIIIKCILISFILIGSIPFSIHKIITKKK